MSDATCACPSHPGRTITDPVRHAAFHELVVEQGGPAGVVDAQSLQAHRGMRTAAPDMHSIRERHLREGKSSPGWRREASR